MSLAEMETWFLHEENRELLAGRRSKPVFERGYGCVLLMALPFLLAGGFIGVMAAKEWFDYFRLRSADAVQVEARVTGLNYSRSSRGGSSYRVEFDYPAFVTDTTTAVLSGTHQITKETYESLKEGDPVEVRYDGRNPSLARMPGGTTDTAWSLGLMTLFVCLYLVLPVAMFAGGIIALRRQRLLVAQGRRLPGRVTSAAVQRRKGGERLEISYEFLNPLGRPLTGKSSISRKHQKGEGTRPDKGTPVEIWYADDRVHEML